MRLLTLQTWMTSNSHSVNGPAATLICGEIDGGIDGIGGGVDGGGGAGGDSGGSNGGSGDTGGSGGSMGWCARKLQSLQS
eukprot:6961580-Prymnesium_polylepis.1